ncbi:MAG: glutamate racemase [bacterium]
MIGKNNPIGVFDSGVGGLTVASVIMREMPRETIYYYADTGNVPYGPKSPETIRKLVFEILDFLVNKGVKAIVMACNTSSALVLPLLRDQFPVPLIGVIEPGARTALSLSRNRRIGVIANEATVRSNAYAGILQQDDSSVVVKQKSCPLLVPLVEKGEIRSAETREVLKSYLKPLSDEGIDTLIMGCTHYPFLEGPIAEILGEGVSLVNPAERTVAVLQESLKKTELLRVDDSPPEHRFFVSGDADEFRRIGSRLLGRAVEPAEKVTPVKNPVF